MNALRGRQLRSLIADWARILPTGDPSGANGEQTFPVPRQGAAAFTWTSILVGGNATSAADTLIFGGRDADGNYLNDIWILRAYDASLTRTNETWSGSGSGSPTTGASADGQGVTVQYMTQCAVSLGSTSSTSSSSPTSSNSPTSSSDPGKTGQSSTSPGVVYNVSILHKSLPAVSAALFLPALVLYRLSTPFAGQRQFVGPSLGLMYLSILVGATAYAIGVVGFAIGFTSISAVSAIVKRSSSSLHLQTAHAKAGLAIFAALYLLVPFLQLFAIWYHRRKPKGTEQVDGKMRSDSVMEKLSMNGERRAVSPSGRSERTSHEGEGKRRVRSWAGIGTWAGIASRRSNETTTDDQTPSQPSFEVVNRPTRQRRVSANSLAAFSDPRPTHTPRNLSDMSWLDPRRSVSGMVGRFDLFLSLVVAHILLGRRVRSRVEPDRSAGSSLDTGDHPNGNHKHQWAHALAARLRTSHSPVAFRRLHPCSLPHPTSRSHRSLSGRAFPARPNRRVCGLPRVDGHLLWHLGRPLVERPPAKISPLRLL